MRTEHQIKTEIKALKNLVPVGKFQFQTMAKVDLIVEELEFGVDDTCDEWNELSESERDVVNETKRWKRGETNMRPSRTFGELVV